jgi:plasmid segregation protein ParM
MELGLDIGYSHTKAVGPKRIIFPSFGRPARQIRDLGIGRIPDYYLLEPFEFFTGELAIEQGGQQINRGSDWIETQEYLAYFLTALAASTDATQCTFTVVTGLPISYLAYKEQVKDRFLGTHKVRLYGRDFSQVFHVNEIKVLPQGMGGLLSVLLHESGRVLDQEWIEDKLPGIVLDIGGQTTNFVTIKGVREVMEQTTSIPVGVWQIEDKVRSFLETERPGLADGFSSHELMDAINTGIIYDRNKPIDLKPISEPLIGEVIGKILNKSATLWNSARHFRRILLCGGGAKLFERHIKDRYPNAELVEDWIYANSRGFCNLARYINGRRR